ncbi:MAG: hypothetical protein ACFE75_11715, partial [Candidatus Hodarchaeota archaeon]
RILNPYFLLKFGEIKFAEENSIPINDFELSLKRYFTSRDKIPHGRYKFGEIDNSSVKDFTRSFLSYFE